MGPIDVPPWGSVWVYFVVEFNVNDSRIAADRLGRTNKRFVHATTE
jgi:hypothetical protein